MAGPGLECAVLRREKEKPASLGVCGVREGPEGRPLVMEPQRRDLGGAEMSQRLCPRGCVSGCDTALLCPIPVHFTLLTNGLCANAKKNTVFLNGY